MKHPPDYLFLSRGYKLVTFDYNPDLYPYQYFLQSYLDKKLIEVMNVLSSINLDDVGVLQHDKIEQAQELLESLND